MQSGTSHVDLRGKSTVFLNLRIYGILMYTVLGTRYLGHIHPCAIQEPQVSDTDRLFTMLPLEKHSQRLRRGY